jgi:hypothetical protein
LAFCWLFHDRNTPAHNADNSIPMDALAEFKKACKQKSSYAHPMWTVLTPIICASGVHACSKLQCINGCILVEALVKAERASMTLEHAKQRMEIAEYYNGH